MARRNVLAMAPRSTGPYDAPGFVADLDEPLLKVWNDTIREHYAGQDEPLKTRFFTVDPSTVANGVESDAVKWSADPAEPNFCVDRKTARETSDWAIALTGHPLHDAFGSKGRVEVQNEYCEYAIKYAQVGEKHFRAKRVIITTELREYWLMLATHAPNKVQQLASALTGLSVQWADLYGPGVADPLQLSADERAVLFSTWVAGAAQDRVLLDKGVPPQPLGALNRRHALFMTHPINGLDDLLYIIMFGARPYARREGAKWVKANRDEIFTKEGVEHLACRHADPAAAIGAHDQAFDGRQVAVANPFGMYIRSFAQDDFIYKGKPVPAEWVRFSRGSAMGLFQRLELGPPDDEQVFLEDIQVGDNAEPLTGGFQVLERLEVGPLLRIGDKSVVTEQEFQAHEVTSAPPITCAQAAVCRRMKRLKDELEEAKARDLRNNIKFGP